VRRAGAVNTPLPVRESRARRAHLAFVGMFRAKNGSSVYCVWARRGTEWPRVRGRPCHDIPYPHQTGMRRMDQQSQACAGWTRARAGAARVPEKTAVQHSMRGKSSPGVQCSGVRILSQHPKSACKHASRVETWPVSRANGNLWARGNTWDRNTFLRQLAPCASARASVRLAPCAADSGGAWRGVAHGKAARRTFPCPPCRALRAVKNVACPLRDCPREQKPSAQVLMVARPA